jgi:hypothetical protein
MDADKKRAFAVALIAVIAAVVCVIYTEENAVMHLQLDVENQKRLKRDIYALEREEMATMKNLCAQSGPPQAPLRVTNIKISTLRC